MRKKGFIISGLLFILLLTQAKIYAEEFKRALPGRTFSFPQDHFSHPEFKTEWWYYSGHLRSEDKKSYGYHLTFFRTALRKEVSRKNSKWTIRNLYFAHLAITDESKKRFEYREKISRGSFDEAGASEYKSGEKAFRVWIEDWSAEINASSIQNHILRAGDKEFGIELRLSSEKGPVIHGQNGISQKAKGEGYASHYYSITRLKTEGKIFLKGKVVSISGTSWIDHEFGSNQLREDQAGWDWFGIQLENGVDLMLYQIRHRDRKMDPYSSGTIVFHDGSQRHLTVSNFQVEAMDQWKSAKSGATYPSHWRIKIPGHQIELILSPTTKDQELVTNQSTRVTYWEGSVKVEGKSGSDRIKGMGYVELTGYAKPFNKGI